MRARLDSAQFLAAFFVNHGLFQSRDLRETAQRCARALGPHRMSLRGTAAGASSFNGLVADELAIVRLCHDFPVTIEPQSGDDYIVHHLLTGSGFVADGRRRYTIAPGAVTVISPGCDTAIGIAANALNAVVRLPRSRVEAQLRGLSQHEPDRPVAFELRLDGRGTATACWANAVRHACEQFELAGRVASPDRSLDGVIADYLAALLLQVQPFDQTLPPERQAGWRAPHYLRRACDYIHGNLGEALTLPALACAAGVSARTLQDAFRRHLGRSPMQYLRDQRVERVHRELLAAGPEARVTDIFTAVGITDFGRYARYYRQRYGMRPSERLRNRGQGRVP